MITGVLVLAAGKSTRIAGVTGGLPKPLLRVGGKSILSRNLEWLAESGIRSVWINLHHHPELVQQAVGDGRPWGLQVRYSHEPELLGTAGAWKRLDAYWEGTSLVVYGDNLLRFDLRRFLEHHRSAGALATIALFDPGRHPNTGIAGGYVELGPQDRVARFVEGTRPAGGHPLLVNAGAYLLEPSLRTAVGAGFQDFGRNVFPALAASGRLAGYVLEPNGYCLGVDTPESLQAAHLLIAEERIALT
jgi:mannose-1-phosphate guanylyltransferase